MEWSNWATFSWHAIASSTGELRVTLNETFSLRRCFIFLIKRYVNFGGLVVSFNLRDNSWKFVKKCNRMLFVFTTLLNRRSND